MIELFKLWIDSNSFFTAMLLYAKSMWLLILNRFNINERIAYFIGWSIKVVKMNKITLCKFVTIIFYIWERQNETNIRKGYLI